jgi:hypothetical protein
MVEKPHVKHLKPISQPEAKESQKVVDLWKYIRKNRFGGICVVLNSLKCTLRSLDYTLLKRIVWLSNNLVRRLPLSMRTHAVMFHPGPVQSDIEQDLA